MKKIKLKEDLSEYKGIIPAIYRISEEKIKNKMAEYRSRVDDKRTNNELRPFIINQIISDEDME